MREAVELDPKNWDARRMLTAICANSNDEYVSYLLDNRAAVEHDIENSLNLPTIPMTKNMLKTWANAPIFAGLPPFPPALS